MYNYKEELVTLLETTGIPVFYEHTIYDSETPTPCITYAEIGDVANKEGGKLRYFRKTYAIKYWCDGLSDEQAANMSLIDSLLYSSGFKRTYYNEMSYGNELCIITNYEALGKEEIGG